MDNNNEEIESLNDEMNPEFLEENPSNQRENKLPQQPNSQNKFSKNRQSNFRKGIKSGIAAKNNKMQQNKKTEDAQNNSATDENKENPLNKSKENKENVNEEAENKNFNVVQFLKTRNKNSASLFTRILLTPAMLPMLLIAGGILLLLLFIIIGLSLNGGGRGSSSGSNNYTGNGEVIYEYNGSLSEFLRMWEGTGKSCTIDGQDGYLSYYDTSNIITIGIGLTNAAIGEAFAIKYIEENNIEKYFTARDGRYYVEYQACIPKKYMDDIKTLATQVGSYRVQVDNIAKELELDLMPHQIEAMVSFNYNLGAKHTRALLVAYKDGGYEGLWNLMSQYDCCPETPLRKRRKGEMALFVTGDYTDQGLFYGRSLENYWELNSEGILEREYKPVYINGNPGVEGYYFENPFTDLYFTTPLNGMYNCTSPYQRARTLTINGTTSTRNHVGLDFGAPTGVEVLAMEDGVVAVNSYDAGGYGYYVSIAHESEGYEKIRTVYAHFMKKSHLNVGDVVKQGDVIGYVGSTGASTGPHLHLGIYINGEGRDPSFFLNVSQVAPNYDSIKCRMYEEELVL